jgi:hypothetical protein
MSGRRREAGLIEPLKAKGLRGDVGDSARSLSRRPRPEKHLALREQNVPNHSKLQFGAQVIAPCGVIKLRLDRSESSSRVRR